MSSPVSEPAPLVSAPSSSAQSPGAWLREQRQQKGLHIAALAAMLKVPQAKLEALEADRWQDLPDTTFARALAKAMCSVLKVDAAPVMALLPRGSERELDVSRGLNQPYRERGGRDEGGSMALLQRPVVWGPVLLLLAAAAVYFVPANWLTTPSQTDAAAPTTVLNPAPIVAEPAASAPLESASEVPPPVIAATPPVVAASPAVATPAPAAASAAVPLAAGLVPLTVKVTAESWVEVVDARGQTLLSKLLRPGDALEVAGQPPLKLRVGNVAGTAMTLRGKPVDLAAQSRDNVARLELN